LFQKKALQALKAPKQEPDKPIIKRPSDARDAREVARKLLKSGSIQPIQKPTLKQDQTFKRPKGQERQKRQNSDSSGSSLSYQPFSNVPTTPDTPEKDSP
jgi:negative elongation factor E